MKKQRSVNDAPLPSDADRAPTRRYCQAKEMEARSAGYNFKPEFERVINAPIQGLPARNGQEQYEMARDGMRYGNKHMPRYSTGRADGAAPEFPWGVGGRKK